LTKGFAESMLLVSQWGSDRLQRPPDNVIRHEIASSWHTPVGISGKTNLNSIIIVIGKTKMDKATKQKLQELNKKQLAKSMEVTKSPEEKGHPKPIRILILILTLLPFAHIIFFMSVFFMAATNSHGMRDIVPILFFSHFATMIFMVGLIGFYISYIFKSPRVDKDKKALWAVVIFLGNMIAMPIFWYLYIWKDPEIREDNL
jgi:hypothetical protein